MVSIDRRAGQINTRTTVDIRMRKIYAIVEDHDEDTGACRVRSAFHMLELQFGEQQTYGGAYIHDLVPDGDSYKIKLKRVDLINCDAPLEIMQAFL